MFNGLSGVKEDLRQYIRLDGKPLGCIDIRCSQPALLANLLTKPPNWLEGNPNYNRLIDCRPSTSPDSFFEVASSGEMYDQLADSYDCPRDHAKRKFLVDVLAKRGWYPSDFEDTFRDLFPIVWKFIREFNRDSHRHLIRLLQEAEARLVIEHVCPRLVGPVPIVTLHDAVFCGQCDLQLVQDTFQEVLEELGVQMELKQETWGPVPEQDFAGEELCLSAIDRKEADTGIDSVYCLAEPWLPYPAVV